MISDKILINSCQDQEASPTCGKNLGYFLGCARVTEKPNPKISDIPKTELNGKPISKTAGIQLAWAEKIKVLKFKFPHSALMSGW